MPRYARVQDGRVFEFLEIDVDPNTLFGGNSWADVTDKPEVLWNWVGILDENGVWTFTEPPIPYVDPRPEMRNELAEINRNSVPFLRTLLLSMPEIGVGTPARQSLEDLQTRTDDILTEIENLPPPPAA